MTSPGGPPALPAAPAAAPPPRALRRRATGGGGAGGLALVIAWLLAPACGWAAAASRPLAALQAQADVQVVVGFDRTDAALAGLTAMDPAPRSAPADPRSGAAGAALAPTADPAAQRVILLARGLVLANAGRAAEARAVIAALNSLAAPAPTGGAASGAAEPLASADAALVQATLAQSQGQVAEAVQAATTALAGYDSLCRADAGCDWRQPWHARMLLARQGLSTGQTHVAREHALAAAELARAAGDAGRQSWSLASAADLSAALGDPASEQRMIARAQRLARLDGSPAVAARVKIFETRLHQHHGDAASARRAAEQGVALARQAHSTRLEALLLANLSDIHVKSSRPQAALQVVEQALPLARATGDRRTEQVLLHNAALARIALGQGEGAHRVLDELLRSHASRGAAGDQVVVLREFADAFAAAGDPAAALALYHRERKLAAEIMAANREAALAELRARFDREAQQRRLQQLGRDSALMSVQLDNRSVMNRVWIAGAAVLLLAVALVALLYRRVRGIHQRLAHNHAFLRAQSHLDPLTGLANRRALHEQAAALGADRQFSGALVLVDIDHFKHVNDAHGHGHGDLVLVEVARRLAAVVGDALLVRWGGEEFLVFMPGAGLAQAQALAARVLDAVAGDPVALPGGPLRVTASLGYGSFPLPPARLALSLERAVNLADMALYTAKSQGRNLAIGIASAQVDDAAALREIEADFDHAWHAGRVSLLRLAGPAEAAAEAAAAPERAAA